MTRECTCKQAALGSGLTILAEIMPWTRSASVGVFVGAGARDEDPEHAGVNHLLEHMVFQGGGSRSACDVRLAFSSMRARASGFANEDCTAYYASASARHQFSLLELWSELMEPALRSADVEQEKQAVLREIQDRADDPSMSVADMARQLHFGSHGCGRNILGTRDSLMRVDSRIIRAHYDRWYTPANMVLACTGNIDWEAFVDRASALFGDRPAGGVPGRETSECRGSGAVAHYVQERLCRRHFCFVTAAPSAQSALSHASLALTDMMGGGAFSRLHAALVASELAESAESRYDALDGTGALYTYVSGRPGRMEDIIEALTHSLRRAAGGDMTVHDLEASKRRLIGRMESGAGMPHSRIVPMALGWLYRKRHLPLADEIAAVRALQMQEVQRLLEEYPMEPITVATLGPAPVAQADKTGA